MNAPVLTPKGLAFCEFAFRDAPEMGLTPLEAYDIGMRLIGDWDGSLSLKRMYLAEKAVDDDIVYDKAVPDGDS
jgi:hypothetical protein